MKNFKNNWIILALVPVVVLLANTTVMANEVSRVTVSDVNKQVISKQPYRVEVCTNQTFQNDTTGDMLLGGIIGGLVGNQIGKGGGKNATTGLGALTGAIIGNNKNKHSESRVVCNLETRYNESSVTVYSHSIATFTYNGRQYSLSFKK